MVPVDHEPQRNYSGNTVPVTMKRMNSNGPSYTFDTLAEDDVLTTSLFHKVLVGFNRPAGWPAWGIGLIVGVLSFITFAWWWLWSDLWPAMVVASLQLIFFISDAYLLQQLPKRRISFGPWKGQFFALVLPRLAATIIIALVGSSFGWLPAIITVVAVQLLGTMALYHGAVMEPRRLGLSHLEITTGRLPSAAQPIRLLHISDIHLERWSVREDQLLEHIQQTVPDLIVITGDFVNLSFNADPITHAQVRVLLSKITAPCGVYAVLGSPPVDLHDTIPALFEGLAVRLLRNEVAVVEIDANRRLVLIGLDCHHDLTKDTNALDAVRANTPDVGPQVLLFHSPELMPQAVEHGIDLYVCGHTHGGQVRLPIIGPVLTSSRLGRRYAMGHYHEGQTHLYISRGIGFEGLGAPRVRLLCPPELMLVTLAPASAANQAPVSR